ncbi:MAG: ABC transporter permease [Candidatus Dormibacteraeota bacterium]|jgi:D-xylose transport system permease protein|nr:ABC transporter permease [Candidatus Dormibacteraeota bacterium]
MTTKPSSVAPSEPSAAEGLSSAAVDVVPPEIVAESLGQYLSVMGRRIANGNTGALPVVLALVAISIGFEIWTQGLFLSPGNLVNLFIESMVFMTLGMAEIFVLLLGEIDLSAGYVLAVGAGIVALLVQKPGPNFAWWLAIIIALVCCGVTGAVWGALVSRLHLPSFVVTLAGLLIMWGVMLVILGNAGDVSISSAILSNQHTVYEIVNGNIPPLAGWISMVIVAVVLGGVIWTRDAGRRSRGLVAPPVGVTAVKVGFLVVAGAVVVAICNVNRGEVSSPVEGVPYVVPVVFAVLILWVILLQRTRFGRYVYAIGGNPDAARRAGISLPAIRTWAFVLSGVTAGFAGILYLSWQGGTSTNVNGGQYVLYGVAAAVIGGTSLFGGRGKIAQAILGGLIIGAIYNGLYLQGVQVQWQLIATGVVLVAAVLIDTVSRRGNLTGSSARI